MTSHRLSAGAILLATGLGLSTALPASAATGDGAWTRPQCGTVDGDGSVTITRTGGRALAPTSGQLTRVTYTKLAALDAPNTLVAIAKNSVQRSTDAGCSWQQIGTTPDDLAVYEVAAGANDAAYVYSPNDQPIHRVKGSELSTVAGPLAGDGVVALAADRSTPGTLRTVAKNGQVFDSEDDGGSWHPIGAPAGADQFLYHAAIDPRNRDHIFIGTMSAGSFVTFDGGRTWSPSKGLGRAFSVAISPADPSIVWAEGYNPDGQGYNPRNIWRSTDGGQTFAAMIDGSRAMLINGNKMWASPVDPDLLYFTYGTSFGGYGADLYQYRPSTDELTWEHNQHDGIPGLAFNPADPKVLYVGLAEER